MRRAARHPSDVEYAAKAVTFAMTSLATLTGEQADHFVQHGYVAVPGCVDPDLAQRWTDLAYRRLGYDPDDPATWSEEIVDRLDLAHSTWRRQEILAEIEAAAGTAEGQRGIDDQFQNAIRLAAHVRYLGGVGVWRQRDNVHGCLVGVRWCVIGHDQDRRGARSREVAGHAVDEVRLRTIEVVEVRFDRAGGDLGALRTHYSERPRGQVGAVTRRAPPEFAEYPAGVDRPAPPRHFPRAPRVWTHPPGWS